MSKIALEGERKLVTVLLPMSGASMGLLADRDSHATVVTATGCRRLQMVPFTSGKREGTP